MRQRNKHEHLSKGADTRTQEPEHCQGSCGLAAAANHSTSPNARLDRNPDLQSLRRHFSGGPHQALPPVPVLLARRRIAIGEEITWTYPPEFVRRLQSVGAW